MSWLKNISEQIPVQGRLKNLLLTGGYLGVFNPKMGVCQHMLEDIQQNANWSDFYPHVVNTANMGLWATSGLCLPFVLSKLKYPILDAKGDAVAKKKIPEVELGEMTLAEKELFTNIMITGAIGSGKTSSAIYPLLRQLFDIYNITDGDPTNPFQKLGGLVMDVKGDFYEALICFMHWAGRNVLEDLVVLTPWANYEFIEFQDPETELFWCVSARGGGDKGSNELVKLLEKHYLPDPVTGKPDGLNPMPVSYCTANERNMSKPISPSVAKTNREYLEELTFEVPEGLLFLGWREQKDGYLHRVSHTNKQGEVVYLKDSQGKHIRYKPPKLLKFRRVRGVNNGLTFNICPPSLGPTEMANRLVAMGKNASGKGDGGGDNAFWDDATKKHIGWVTQLFRTINPDSEITAIDINRMTVDQSTIDKAVNALKDHIDEVERKARTTSDPGEKNTLIASLDILGDMRRYFEGEWATLDMKTKSNLISTITNVFGQFMNDARLRSTFCVASSFNLVEVMQSGKVFTLVAPEYESAARVFGTSLKMEFQALLRRRTAQPHLNKDRFILFACDEAQNFVVCGGNDPSSGDENFMALSRQSKVANIIATQTDASIINVVGEKAADVYYAQFGTRVWYQNTDQKTNKRASEILGKIKKEKVSRSGQDFQVATVFAKDGHTARGYNETVNIEEKERFPPETFPNLDVHECVIYNKGKKGARDKALRNKVPPDPIGAPWEVDNKNQVIRWYFQAYIENQLHKTDQGYILDPKKKEKPPVSEEEKKDAEILDEVDFDKNVAVPKVPKNPSSGTPAKTPAAAPKTPAATAAKPKAPINLEDDDDTGAAVPDGPPPGSAPLPTLDDDGNIVMPGETPKAKSSPESAESSAEGAKDDPPKPTPKPKTSDVTDDLDALFEATAETPTPTPTAETPSTPKTEVVDEDPEAGREDNTDDLLGLTTISCIFASDVEDETDEDTDDSLITDTFEDEDVSDPLQEIKEQDDISEEGLAEVKQIIGGTELTDRFGTHVSIIQGASKLGVDFEAIQSEHFDPESIGKRGEDIIGKKDIYSPSANRAPLKYLTDEDKPDDDGFQLVSTPRDVKKLEGKESKAVLDEFLSRGDSDVLGGDGDDDLEDPVDLGLEDAIPQTAEAQQGFPHAVEAEAKSETLPEPDEGPKGTDNWNFDIPDNVEDDGGSLADSLEGKKPSKESDEAEGAIEPTEPVFETAKPEHTKQVEAEDSDSERSDPEDSDPDDSAEPTTEEADTKANESDSEDAEDTSKGEQDFDKMF